MIRAIPLSAALLVGLASTAIAQDADTVADDPVAALTSQCAEDNAAACTRLGNRLIEGNGVARDDARGLWILAKGCQLGDMRGCTMAGYLYSQGKTIGRSAECARDYYAYACHGGEATGCSNLGLAYVGGDGGSKDDARAAALFRKAARQGRRRAAPTWGPPTRWAEAWRAIIAGQHGCSSRPAMLTISTPATIWACSTATAWA
jgi:hypothetical protein